MTTEEVERLPPLDLLGPPCRTCNGRSGVRRFLTGHQCPEHTPAALAGRITPTPDPAMTAEGLRGRTTNRASSARYGTATNDPSKCPDCTGKRARNHKGDHT